MCDVGRIEDYQEADFEKVVDEVMERTVGVTNRGASRC
jgi:hypothetical protein